MAHNLLNDSMFYNRSTTPAWHSLGINDPTDHTAEGALRRVTKESGKDDIFGIIKQPLMVTLPGMTEPTESGYYALVREPAPGRDFYEVIGTPVSADFEAIGPADIARLCDTNIVKADGTPVPVDTLGLLGKGDRMFTTYELPSYDVKGDEIKMYLIFDAPFANGISLGGFTSGVRVVCQNTLNAAIGRSVQQFEVTHTKGASEQVAKWLSAMYSNALESAALLAEAYNVLAKTKIKEAQVKWIIDAAYPLPNPEVEEFSANARLPLAIRQEMRDKNIARIVGVRESVFDLYKGAGVGMDTPAVKGTAFGAYNAVAEYETWGRKATGQRAVGALINGARGARIRNAFTLAMNVKTWETVTPALEYVPIYGG